MFSFNKRNAKFIGLISLAVGAIFAPDLASHSSSRNLAAVDEDGRRSLQDDEKPAPPLGMGLKCGEGEVAYSLDWKDVEMDFSKPVQTVTFANGMDVTIRSSTTGGAIVHRWDMWENADGSIKNPVLTTKQFGPVIGTDASVDPEYPEAFVSMEMEFDHDLKDLYISIGDVDSTSKTTDAVRIRMFDAAGSSTPLKFSATGTIKGKPQDCNG